jgi:hypothetical protein
MTTESSIDVVHMGFDRAIGHDELVGDPMMGTVKS